MADNTKVVFKRGPAINLPEEIAEGTIYITTDEYGMHVDIDGRRIRIGDFREFTTLTELRANTNPSADALYYVTELNCLAKWNGNKYVHINLDTGATSIEVVGNGNAVTSAAYDPATRKLTLTADATYATPDEVDARIDDKLGACKNTCLLYLQTYAGRKALNARIRDPAKTTYGLDRREDGSVPIVLETSQYDGEAEVSVIVSNTEYKAKNMCISGTPVPNRTLIFKKVEG